MVVELADGIRPGGQTVDLRAERPYIDRCQGLPNGIDGYVSEISWRYLDHRQRRQFDAAPAFRGFAEEKWFTTADVIDLPDYRTSSAASVR